MVIWVIKISFVQFCVFLPPFLISSASVRSIPFLSFIMLIFAWNVPLVSLVFLKRSPVFPRFSYLSLLFFRTLHSDGYLSFSPLPLASLLSQLFVMCHQTTILPFYISFSWRWSWSLPPVQCHEPLSIVLQALCLSDLIPWIYFSLPLYNHKGFDLGHTWMF